MQPRKAAAMCGLAVCFFSVFKFELNYNLICLEFCLVLLPMLFLFRVGRCYAIVVDFDLVYLT